MPFYESVFIARQDISNTQVEALADAFSEIIEKGGGSVSSKEQWGLRNLAYKIKKNRKGHYTMFNIDAPSAAILEMERNMRINEDVLRYLTVRVDKLSDEPSIMMQRSRGPRDDDTRRGGRPYSGDGPRRGGHPAGGAGRDGKDQADKKPTQDTDAAKPEDKPQDKPQDAGVPAGGDTDTAKPEDKPQDKPQDAGAPAGGDTDTAKPEDKPEDKPQDAGAPAGGDTDAAKPEDKPQLDAAGTGEGDKS